MTRPDPVVSASLYCDRALDEALASAVIPFRAGLSADWGLWFVRYSRGGEHLKLRLHGPGEEAARVRERLEGAVSAFFGALSPAAGAPRVARPEAPAIDAEDEEPGERPDRTLRWTTYRRSPVSLGPAPLLEDDGYSALVTASLARASDVALEALRSPGAPDAARQRALLKALVAGLGAASFPAARCCDYLAYHRDWLVRFFCDDAAREAEVRARFGQQAERARALREQLGTIAAARWCAPAPAADTAEERLGAAVRGLAAYLDGRPGAAERVDPFTHDRAFPALFKVFHGLANQLGMTPTAEAFVHHLLREAAARGCGVEAA